MNFVRTPSTRLAIVSLAACLSASLVVGLLGASTTAGAAGNGQDGVFIMGIDGMDPTIL